MLSSVILGVFLLPKLFELIHEHLENKKEVCNHYACKLWVHQSSMQFNLFPLYSLQAVGFYISNKPRLKQWMRSNCNLDSSKTERFSRLSCSSVKENTAKVKLFPRNVCWICLHSSVLCKQFKCSGVTVTYIHTLDMNCMFTKKEHQQKAKSTSSL